MSILREQLDLLAGAPVVDRDGRQLGTVQHIYLDDDTGEPIWATVGRDEGPGSYVPLQAAEVSEQGLRVDYTADHVAKAPTLRHIEHLDDHDLWELYRHYDMDAVMAHDRRSWEAVEEHKAPEGFDLPTSGISEDRPASSPAAYEGGGDAVARLQLRRHEWPEHPTGMDEG